MAKKEEEHYPSVVIKAAMEAQKREEEKAAQAAAAGASKEPPKPKLEQVIELAIRALGHPKADKPELIKELHSKASLMFERAVRGSAYERFQARHELTPLRYTPKSPDAAKKELEAVWWLAAEKKVAPKMIVGSPNKLIDSAVAMELVANLTALRLDKDLTGDYRAWWQEVARAYQSIDFANLTPRQAEELRGVFTKSFTQMRKLAEAKAAKIEKTGALPESVFVPPKDDEIFWRGLGDYYFSASLDESVPAPEGINSGEWKEQRIALNTYFRTELQPRLLSIHTRDQEIEILKEAEKKLEKGLQEQRGKDRKDPEFGRWKYLRREVEGIQHRLVSEIEEFNVGREGIADRLKGGAQARAEYEEFYEDWTKRPPRAIAAGLGFSYNVEDGLRAFAADPKTGEDPYRGARKILIEMDNLFRPKDPSELFAWDNASKLQSAMAYLQDIERNFALKPEQRLLIESWQANIRKELEAGSRRLEAPSRFYLTQQELDGLRYDPIGTSERMFADLVEALIEDPDGPRAHFAMERLELMQYYLFSRQHTEWRIENFDIVVVEKREDLMRVVLEGKGKLRGRKLTAEKIVQLQKDLDELHFTRGGLMTGEKMAFERSFINRYHEAIFIQQWKHATEFSDERFQQFINTRMQEDDFWAMDGLYGGLVARFRQVLRIKYIEQMYDSRGEITPHQDRLWAKAIEDTIAELKNKEKYPEFAQIWDNYINGEYFKEVPGSGPASGMRRPSDQELLARGIDPKTIEEQMTYEEAVPTIAKFASMRMIMSQEKYLLDARFLPTRWGAEMGFIPLMHISPDGTLKPEYMLFSTQFYEKQKVVKLFKTFEGWQITWGGITLGMSGEERFMMRHRAELWRTAVPEINDWAQERTREWWKKIQRFDTLNPEEQRLFYGQIRALFSFSVDKLDIPPSWSSPEKASQWLKTFMTEKKLRQEWQFYSAMEISDTFQHYPYLCVTESGARRAAQVGALAELLGEADPFLVDEERKKTDPFLAHRPLTKQNFLSAVELDSAYGYFPKKIKEDTLANKASFLSAQAFLARYEPHERLLVLREGESLAAQRWIEANMDGGKEGFARFIGETSLIYEDLRAELLLQEQIDYTQGVTGLSKPVWVADVETTLKGERKQTWRLSTQAKVVDRFFGRRFGKRADEEKTQYFSRMQKICQFLLDPVDAAGYDYLPVKKLTGTRYGAVEELTHIRYAPLLIRVRRDDYPYEIVQYPERAFPLLRNCTDHVLHEKSIGDVRRDKVLKDMYLTRASDKFEPSPAFDEQSGLWRRNLRDLGGISRNWQLIGEAWSGDDQRSRKAREERYKTCVGIQGEDPAKINDLFDDGQRILFQLVYARYGPFLENAPGSSDMKKVHPHKKSISPDEALHKFEEGQEVTGGRSRLTAPGAIGIEYAVKKKMRAANWNDFFGGMTGRAEFVEKVQHWAEHLNRNPFERWLARQAMRVINEKNMEDLVEWFDLRAPLGVWGTKGLILGAAGLLLFVIYNFQQVRSAGKEEKEHH